VMPSLKSTIVSPGSSFKSPKTPSLANDAYLSDYATYREVGSRSKVRGWLRGI
jgi:hypothetical protein